MMMMIKTLLLIILVSGTTLTNASSSVNIPLTMLNEYESAKCLDGSVGGYYKYFSNESKNSDKFVIELQGGGECATLTQCTEKLNTNLGSSTKFQKTLNSLSFLNDLDSNRNPVFSTYNHVFIPYVASHSNTHFTSFSARTSTHSKVLTSVTKPLESLKHTNTRKHQHSNTIGTALKISGREPDGTKQIRTFINSISADMKYSKQ